MKPVTLLMACGMLAACGADGEPQRPLPGPSRPGLTVDASTATGVTVTGNVTIGITN